MKVLRSVWYDKIRQNTCKRSTKARTVKDVLSTKITEDMDMSINVWSEKRINLIGDPEEEKEERG